MSECVVRMEMPKEGCHTCDARCVSALYGYICGIERKNVMPFLGKENRPDWCPIICSLPEGHGRLVDANTFSGHMKEYQDKIMKWREQSKMEGPDESYYRADSALLTVVATKLILDNAPTIVPAERSET